jgi:glycosyltransferase involved in cell wall biosynthesis
LGRYSIYRVLHLITDLGQGGAETVLYRLVFATRDRFNHAVVSLHREGDYGPELRAQGIPVTALGMSRGRLNIEGLRRLQRITKEYRPDVIQTRLYHANLLGGLVARFAGAPPVVWAVHSTDLGAFRATWKTRLIRQCCAWSSRSLPAFIVSDARSGAALHEELGFSPAKLVVIRNGVDSASFRPDAAARERTRANWGVAPDETLLGCVARWDPLKDHENLLRALKLLGDRGDAIRCALIGSGMTADNRDLHQIIERHGVRDRVILTGPTNDVPAIMNMLDVHVLSSRSESLPVAVMEAMACGIPCVVTDVGDARDIVGETGWVVPPEDPGALAGAMQAALGDCLRTACQRRAEACRTRIINEFSLARMAAEYGALWANAAEARRRI